MRFYFLLFFIFNLTLSGNAQNFLDLEIEWNATAKRYEVFATPSLSQNNYVMGNSQISIVLPKTAPDTKLALVSHAGGVWKDEKIIASPSADADRDYHGVTTNGGVLQLVAKKKMLLFSFTLANNSCINGVRLFNNEIDPSATDKGFNNIDFKNSLLGVGNNQVYGENLLNSGTKCLDCPAEIKIPILKKLSSLN